MAVNLRANARFFLDKSDGDIKYLLKLARSYDQLSIEEEQALLKEYKSKKTNAERKEEIRNILLLSNLRFVIAVAKRNGSNETFLDLVMEGCIGFMKAIEYFKIGAGSERLCNYAVFYIKQNIRLFIDNHLSTIRLKSPEYKSARLVKQGYNELMLKSGYEPQIEEIQDYVWKTYKKDVTDKVFIRNTLSGKKFITQIDAYDSEDDDSDYNEVVAGFYRTTASENASKEMFEEQDVKSIVDLLLGILPERDRKIMELVYGLNGGIPTNWMMLGGKFGITGEMCRRVVKKSLQKMREFAEKHSLQLEELYRYEQ